MDPPFISLYSTPLAKDRLLNTNHFNSFSSKRLINKQSCYPKEAIPKRIASVDQRNIRKNQVYELWGRSSSLSKQKTSKTNDPKPRILETLNSFLTEGNDLIEDYNSSRQDSTLQNYSALPMKSSISTEVHRFYHSIFPKRKLKVSKSPKKKTLNIYSESAISKKSLKSTSKNYLKYHLKKNFSPVKYKLNFVPKRGESLLNKRSRRTDRTRDFILFIKTNT